MKNNILDTPFLEKHEFPLEDLLEQDEKIIWQGQPMTDDFISELDIVVIGVAVAYGSYQWYFFASINMTILLGVFIYAMFFVQKIYRIMNMRSIYYAITPHRIIWSLSDHPTRKSQTYSIDFKNIKWAEIEDNAIFIRPKNYDLVEFETQSAKDLELRKKPTLENVENIIQVHEIIEQYIDENNSK